MSNIFSPDDLLYLREHGTTVSKMEELHDSHKLRFTLPLTDSIKNTLIDKLNLDLSNTSEIPMSWVNGDSAPHVDRGTREFKKTHLVYLTDSEGSFITDEEYPIVENTAYVFNEGTEHKTVNTIGPRLLLGPMNEYVEPVGGDNYIIYYTSKENYDTNTFNQSNVVTLTGGGGSEDFTFTPITIGSVNTWVMGTNNVICTAGNTYESLVVGATIITPNYSPYITNYGYLIRAYPTIPITYYSNKANALANTNSVGSSTLPIIGSVTTGRTGGHTFWSIASNTASYPVTSQVYISGFELAPGAFKLYPAAPPPPLMKVPPITLSYVYYLLPSVNAQMATLARFSANYATLVTLMTLLLKNIVAKPKPIGPTVLQKRQILSLASRFISAATLNNNKTSYNVQLLNQAQMVVSQNILPVASTTIQTIVQTMYAKYIGAEAPLMAVQDRAFKLIDLTKTVYARALLVNSAVIVTPTSSAAIVTANRTALTNLNTSVTALKASLDSMNTSFLTVKGATRTGIQPNIVSATTSVIALAKL